MSDPILIVSAARTPIGGMLGDFASLQAYQLGSAAIRAEPEENLGSSTGATEVLHGRRKPGRRETGDGAGGRCPAPFVVHFVSSVHGELEEGCSGVDEEGEGILHRGRLLAILRLREIRLCQFQEFQVRQKCRLQQRRESAGSFKVLLIHGRSPQ